MTGKLIRVKGYNYKNKDGFQKVGRLCTIQTKETKAEDDGSGNFDYGLLTEEIVFRNESKPTSELMELLGKEVDFVLERNIGDKYEKLVDIVAI